ncbi:MAG: sulfur carrier protein [Gammaproteobacteria bacterium]|jgi:sulfur carrier protein
MQITLNGESIDLDNSVNIDQLLSKLELSGRLAVEVNQRIIPRSLFSTYEIESGDHVEIVTAIGGG